MCVESLLPMCFFAALNNVHSRGNTHFCKAIGPFKLIICQLFGNVMLHCVIPLTLIQAPSHRLYSVYKRQVVLAACVTCSLTLLHSGFLIKVQKYVKSFM